MAEDASFEALVDVKMSRLTPAEWEAWYPRMAAWLGDADPRVRASALERLMQGVFFAENSSGVGTLDARAMACTQRRRTAWLLEEVERAALRHADLLAVFLLELRRHGLRWDVDEFPYPEVVLPCLRGLRSRPEVRQDLVEGAVILVGGLETPRGQLPPQLDHPSDHVRACAAYMLGSQGLAYTGSDERIDPAVLAALTEKEVVRPGLVGPFWFGCGFFGADPGFDATGWMLDIIERRHGPEPDDLPFPGVDFHIHEMAAGNPDAIRRLMRAGRADLALMTATEIPGAVEGMAPVLRALSLDPSPSIARQARAFLARHYGDPDP